MAQEVILNEIINAYRRIIDERYQHKNLIKNYGLPTSVSEKQIDEIREYFLTYIYPDLQKRQELNKAFESLDNYIKHPGKLLQILIDSASLIFKHGRYLPKILHSGIKALRSFRDANKFEKQIVAQAIMAKEQPPFGNEAIYSFIRKLPRKDVDHFIDGTRSLFSILHNRKLVHKIIEIVSFLISKMKKHPKSYSKEEIKGLEIGFELIKKGLELFENLSKENQQQLIDFIVKVESTTLDSIYSYKG